MRHHLEQLGKPGIGEPAAEEQRRLDRADRRVHGQPDLAVGQVRPQRHYIEEWVHLLAPLRPDLADGEVRLAVHAAIGAIQSTLFFRSGLADSRLTELLEGMAHGCLGTVPAALSESPLTSDGHPSDDGAPR